MGEGTPVTKFARCSACDVVGEKAAMEEWVDPLGRRRWRHPWRCNPTRPSRFSDRSGL